MCNFIYRWHVGYHNRTIFPSFFCFGSVHQDFLVDKKLGINELHSFLTCKIVTPTAEQAVTWSIISIPASANAVLEAMIAAARHELVPSFSKTVIYTSIADLGSNSKRTAGVSACVKTWENPFSSASWWFHQKSINFQRTYHSVLVLPAYAAFASCRRMLQIWARN